MKQNPELWVRIGVIAATVWCFLGAIKPFALTHAAWRYTHWCVLPLTSRSARAAEEGGVTSLHLTQSKSAIGSKHPC